MKTKCMALLLSIGVFTSLVGCQMREVTEDEVYESKLKLYEMENRLCQCGFFRVSKSCLVHLKFIASLKNDIDRKLRLTMKNGEQIVVSRQYAEEMKRRLGVIK